MNWQLTIKKVENGYIIEQPHELEDEETNVITEDILTTVFEDVKCEDENEQEQLTMRNVLNFVTDHFAVHYSKHNKTNLKIEVVKNEMH